MSAAAPPSRTDASRRIFEQEAYPYILTDEIGKGSFATVYRGHHAVSFLSFRISSLPPRSFHLPSAACSLAHLRAKLLCPYCHICLSLSSSSNCHILPAGWLNNC